MWYCFADINVYIYRASTECTLRVNVLVVGQFYDTDVNKAYVIRGNAAILKCEIPSFVADFVTVVSWHTDVDEVFYPGTDYGLFANPLESWMHCTWVFRRWT